MSPRVEKRILAGMIAGFVVLISVICFFKYRNFFYNGFDLAIYNQAFWNTIHSAPFASSIHAPNYLGDHAEWILIPLALLYALAPHPLTLVFLQALMLGLSAIPLYLIAKKTFTGPSAKWALVIPLLWLLNPSVWGMTLYEFHLLPFAFPFLFGAAYFYLGKKFLPFTLCILGALLCREDAAVGVVGFSFIALFDSQLRWRSKIKWVAAPVLLGILIFFIDQKIISYFNPDGGYKYITYYAWLGGSTGEVIKNIFLHPLNLVRHFATLGTIEFILALFLPLLFIPFFRPRFLLLSIVPAAQLMITATGANIIAALTHYSTLTLVGVLLAGAEALPQFWSSKRTTFVRPIIFPLVITASVYILIAFGPGTAVTVLRPRSAYAQNVTDALAVIPPNTSVLSSIAEFSNLSSRKNIYSLHYAWIGQRQFGSSPYVLPEIPEYIALDQNDFLLYSLTYAHFGWTEQYYASGAARMRALLKNGTYGAVYEKDGMTILKRDTTPHWEPVATYNKNNVAPITHHKKQLFGSLLFTGWTREQNGWKLFFKKQSPISVDAVTRINGRLYPLGNGIYPTSEWRQDETVSVFMPITDPTLNIEIFDGLGHLGYDNGKTLVLAIEKENTWGSPLTITDPLPE